MGDALSRGRGILLLASIFILGMASGASLFYLGQRSALRGGAGSGPDLHSPLEHLSRELDLDAAQKERVHELLDGLRRRMDRSMEECHSEIRALLRPDQLKKFDQFPYRHHHQPHEAPSHRPPQGRP